MRTTILDPHTSQMNENILDALTKYISNTRKYFDLLSVVSTEASDAFMSYAFSMAYANYILRKSLGKLLGSCRTKRLRKKRFMPIANYHPAIARRLSIEITGKAW